MGLKLSELKQKLGVELRGDSEVVISGVSTLQNGRPGTLTFLANSRYRRYLGTTRASAVIIAPEDLSRCPTNALISVNPYVTYARAAALLIEQESIRWGVHPNTSVSASSVIDENVRIGAHCVIESEARIGANTYIGPGCIIGQGVTIGEGCRLIAKVTICKFTEIGSRVIIHPGAVLGSDGFGIANEKGRWIKVPQLGSVNIGDDVEIGANTTIDRGSLEDTVIEEGVKLDNQIQVAHNVVIGAHTAIAGCVGIAGSARIGRRCMIGGGVGILGHLEIADDVHITAMSLVTKSIDKPGTYSSGVPLEANRTWRKNSVRFKQLDEMARRLRLLEEKTGIRD